MLLERKKAAVPGNAVMSPLTLPLQKEKTSVGESCFSCDSLLLNQLAEGSKLLRTKSLYEVSIELMMLTDNYPTFSIRQKIGLS